MRFRLFGVLLLCCTITVGALAQDAPPAAPDAAILGSGTPMTASETAEWSIVALRDMRKAALGRRKRAALITELQGLERLNKVTVGDAPERLQLLRRLAETYVELEYSALLEHTTTAQQEESETKIVRAANAKAIAYYTKLKDEYPQYAKLDEVSYFLTYEFERLGNYEKAREGYLALVVPGSSASNYSKLSQLALAEMLFNEAQSDASKWDLAAAEYKKIFKSVAPDLHGVAHYRLGQIFQKQTQPANALTEFKKVVESCQKFPNTPFAATIADGARSVIILLYAPSSRPDKAFDFIKPISGDTPQKVDHTVGMMMDLAGALASDHADAAVAVYLELMKRVTPSQDARVCGLPPAALTSALSSAAKLEELVRRQAALCH
jgi:tetratricopeptide (TPR) repeat protein